MKKKSINDLVNQYLNASNSRGITVYFAYLQAFKKRFGVEPHTTECANFIIKHGKDYKM